MPNTSADLTAVGRETARILLDIKAVNFRPEEPYKLTAGWASPVYIDCRQIISFTAERRRIIGTAARILSERIGWHQLDAIAGGETAGIPYAAWISEAASLPMLYVRKKPKGFGRDAQIEGDLKEGSRVLLVEDLATKRPFDPARKLHLKVKKAAMAEGLICYPAGGTVNGREGDHILLAPPFIITDDQIGDLVGKLSRAVETALTQ